MEGNKSRKEVKEERKKRGEKVNAGRKDGWIEKGRVEGKKVGNQDGGRK